MTLGIMHAPDEHGPVNQCRRLYFTDRFLQEPPAFWSVQLPHSPPLTEELKAAGWYNLGWTGWPKGTLVKLEFPGVDTVIWALTGRDFPLTTCHVYEGKWPD
jgi:hypothetical protein